MKFLSLQPFVPSGKDFAKAKQFFTELGFSITFDGGDYVGFERDGCRFILQRYDNRQFAENFMISVAVSNAEEFYDEVSQKMLDQKFGIKVGKPVQQPYGKEVNIIDLAGVCWHFVE
jgi:predicted lactoylglutathione lyase